MLGRRSITAKASFSDDEDAITPCSSPPPEPQHQASSHHCYNEPRTAAAAAPSWFSFSARRGSTSAAAAAAAQAWHFDPTDGEDMDNARLWRRMLDIQREFHCYNSARMAAALLEMEMGMDVGPYARKLDSSFLCLMSMLAWNKISDTCLSASRGCLDLLNDSVSDMPVHDKERLVDWLHEHSSRRKRSGIFKRNSGP